MSPSNNPDDDVSICAGIFANSNNPNPHGLKNSPIAKSYFSLFNCSIISGYSSCSILIKKH